MHDTYNCTKCHTRIRLLMEDPCECYPNHPSTDGKSAWERAKPDPEEEL